MEEKEFTSKITSEKVILRYLTEIAKQRIPICIGPEDQDNSRAFTSRIVRVDNTQSIVVQQPSSPDWQEQIQADESLDVTCHMNSGTVRFKGHLSPLDELEDSMYCQLTFPSQLDKKQLRSNFRVSVLKHDSNVALIMTDGTEEVGSCMDISLGGLTVWLPVTDSKVYEGLPIDQCHIAILDILDISCSVDVVRVKNTEKNNLIIGLRFKDLQDSQLNSLHSAINQIERLNITS